MKRICLLSLAWCALTAAPAAFAAFSYDPFLTWRTLYTENFHIHYHDGEEDLAKQVARIAERLHVLRVKQFSWVPSEPTEVILNDRVDFTNGAATPVYQNTMYLYMTPPDDINTLEDFDNWLELLISHEYTHIIHLDKVRGASKVFRNIFGRAPAGWVVFPIFPNEFQPLFYIEGLATYMETDKQRGVGRGQSSSYEMMMRMETVDGIKSLRHVNQPMATWPAGTARYLYGVYFYNFIADTYGKDKVAAWVEKFSGHVIPYALNHTAKHVLGEDLDDVWAKFEKYLHAKFDPQIAEVKRRGEQSGTQLTHDGYYTGHTRFAPNGDVFYVRDDFRDDSYLMVMRKGVEKPRAITRVDGNRFDIHPQAGIVLTQLNVVSNTDYYSDIYHVDANSYKVRRLTRGGRYRSATWSPDGKQIIAVHNDAGNNALHLLDLNGKLIKVLWQGGNMEVIGEPDWSPDGKSLVAPMWRKENRWDLEQFSLEDNKWRRLTNDDNIKMNPQFTADGKSIIFSADYGGIYNIHRMDLSSKQMWQLTNVFGGAFYPSLDAGKDKLVYTGFTGKGYDVFELDLAKARTFEPAAPQAQPVAAVPDWRDDPIPQYHIAPYSPWHTLRPRWWLPILDITQDRTALGVVTGGSDALNRHSYYVAPTYDFNNHWHEGSIGYLYDRFNPALRLTANRSTDEILRKSPTNKNKDVLERITTNDYATAELIFPLLDFNYQWGLHLAAIYNYEHDQKVGPYDFAKPDTTDNMTGVAITYNSAKSFPISISRSGGQTFKLVAENSDYTGGDYSGKIFIGDWREYISLGNQHVLALRLAAGHGTESPRPFQLGGSFSEDIGNPLGQSADQIFNKRDYALRGYDDNLPGLRGNKMMLTSMEYRFPIYRLERGVTAPPIGLHQMHASVFVNGGDAWSSDADKGPTRWGAGFEYHWEFIFGYVGLLDLRVGTATGFNAAGEDAQFYMTLGTSF